MRINHNIAALNTYRQFNNANNAQSKSMEKLSSGLRINKAGDDAAGLAISEKMRGQIRGLDMASKNAQDANSLMATAEGALNETHDILQRMRELSVQASNDTNTVDDRAEIQQEVDQLKGEVDRIGNSTEFNTKKLLNGGAGIQATVTDNAGAALAVGASLSVVGGGAGVKAGGDLFLDSVQAAKTAKLSFEASANGKDIVAGSSANYTFELNGVSISVAGGSTGKQLAEAINNVSGQTGVTAEYTESTASAKGKLDLVSTGVGSNAKIELGGAAFTNAGAATDTFTDTAAASGALTMKDAGGTDLLTADIATTATTATNGVDATATIDGSNTTGVDATSVTANGNTLTVHGGDYDGLQLQVDATMTTADDVKVHVDANNSLNFQIGANENQEINVSISDMRAEALGINNLNVTSQTGAKSAITTIDSAIKSVSAERSKLGAYQNRLDHTINNLSTSSENLTAAESRIRDVDYALAA
ncbi:flagellin [Priestia aryabhattai]|uniref:flagellin N-terminal helical domain-containing protein n=1 Tax=Priestia aryabhattai TaxID=412384 RepID=UPI002436A19F|nr:flagellin [Priestia aryabhattai]